MSFYQTLNPTRETVERTFGLHITGRLHSVIPPIRTGKMKSQTALQRQGIFEPSTHADFFSSDVE
jgi:hypothetical protein